MQIKFTKDEMEKLLELLNIADWVLTSQDIEDDERKDSYLRLLQRVYHEAYENGMTDAIEYDEDAKDYYPNEDWEEKSQIRDFIEEYDDATFWEELVYRLADRDIDRQMDGKAPKNFEQHVAMFTKIQTKYEAEFEKNNLDNVEIVKPVKKAVKPATKAAPKKTVKESEKPVAKKTSKPAKK